MNLLESTRLALVGLTANKLRAFLTMLGIIIGVAAVITLISVGGKNFAQLVKASPAICRFFNALKISKHKLPAKPGLINDCFYLFFYRLRSQHFLNHLGQIVSQLFYFLVCPCSTDTQ